MRHSSAVAGLCTLTPSATVAAHNVWRTGRHSPPRFVSVAAGGRPLPCTRHTAACCPHAWGQYAGGQCAGVAECAFSLSKTCKHTESHLLLDAQSHRLVEALREALVRLQHLCAERCELLQAQWHQSASSVCFTCVASPASGAEPCWA